MSDIILDNHKFTLFLKHSKTNQLNQGFAIIISPINSVFCPLSSMSQLMKIRLHAAPMTPWSSLPMAILWQLLVCHQTEAAVSSLLLHSGSLHSLLYQDQHSHHSRSQSANLYPERKGLLVFSSLQMLCQTEDITNAQKLLSSTWIS